MEALLYALIAVASVFLPDLTESIKEKWYGRRNITTGSITQFLDEVLTGQTGLSSMKAQEMINQFQKTIDAYIPGGSAELTEYMREAKREAAKQKQKIETKAIEQNLYSQSAQSLANLYESLPLRQKASETGKALVKQIKSDVDKSVKAAKDIDPQVDVSKVEQSANKLLPSENVNGDVHQKQTGINNAWKGMAFNQH